MPPARKKKPSASQVATTKYRTHVFVGLGKSYTAAISNAFTQLRAAGYTDARIIDHRSIPSDSTFAPADWRDTDWRDTDWRDTEFIATHEQMVVVNAWGKAPKKTKKKK